MNVNRLPGDPMSQSQTTLPHELWTKREPDLQELLDDPVIRLLMESDGVRIEDLTSFLANVRKRLLAGRCQQVA